MGRSATTPTMASAISASASESETTAPESVADGAREVVVHPYLLGPGRHSREDIPKLAAEAAAAHPGVEVRVSGPLGVHASLVDVILDRVGEA